MNKKWNLQKNTLFPSVNYTELRKNSDIENKFIDYLKISYSRESLFCDRYISLLVSDNSDNSLFEFDWYTFSINRFKANLGPWFKLFVSYNNIPVEFCTIIRYEKWLKCLDGKIKYSCEFKWQYFRLETLWYFDKWFYKQFLEYAFEGEDGRIVRVDRTIDFMQKNTSSDKKLYIVSPLQLLWKTWIRDNATSHQFQKWKAIKTFWNGWENLEKIDYWNWYYGSRKWKRVMLRVYDKQKDISRNTWKWKELLYLDYLKMKRVVRVEFECQTKFCYWYNISTLDKLIEKCDSVFHLSENEWKGSTCYEYKAKDNVIDLENQSEKFKIRYFDSFSQHWYTIFENNINPFNVLSQWIIERTESQFVPYTKNKLKDFLRETDDWLSD